MEERVWLYLNSMEIFIPLPLPDRPENLIRRAGYAEHRDRHSPEVSYTHRAGPDFYPRFHVYIKTRNDGVVFSLHLDQKRPSYGGGTHAHAGEYAGSTVEREGERIRQSVLNSQSTPQDAPKKSGFLGRLFGSGDPNKD